MIGFKEQRQTRNTNDIMIKLGQDTATKAHIWLETNDFGDRSSRRQMVRDKDGRHTKANRRKSRIPPLRQTDNWRQITWEPDKLGGTLQETNDEGQVKARKRHPESRTPLDRVGDKWRETSKETHPKSRTPARLGDKWREIYNRRETSGEPGSARNTGTQIKGD